MSFISQNKILPGVYANFTASGLHAFTPGQRGRVAVFGVFPWGEPKKVLEVEDVTLTAKMGYAMEDSAMLPLKLLFQNATKAFVYRLNEGVQASAQLVSGLTAKAKWGGSRGNDLSVAV
ncbi:MAG: phage tail sheath protein, partial [Oscillospiraceae bacterium]